jgi:hypothetical protein
MTHAYSDGIMNATNLTAAEQDAKYAIGTMIEVEGQPIKADNGRFVIETHFPVQPSGEQYYQWRRVKNGKLVQGWRSEAVRGYRFSWLEKNARIVTA